MECIKTLFITSLLALLATAWPAIAGAMEFLDEETQLFFASGLEDDYIGYSVATWGTMSVSGAPGDDTEGSSAGAAYIHRMAGPNWWEVVKLAPVELEAQDAFGQYVAVNGDVVAVAAPGDDDAASNAGVVYVYRYDGLSWDLNQKIYASDASAWDRFGAAIAIEGDVMVVGAPMDDPAGSSSGSAYVYRDNGVEWIEEGKLIASSEVAGDSFGTSVSVFGDTILVGAPGDDDGGSNSGSAYFFEYDGVSWGEVMEVRPTAPSASDFFGTSVSINGSYALVGAYGDDDGGTNAGAAYMYHHDGSYWQYNDKLIASTAASSDYAGYSVSIRGSMAAIGAPKADGQDANSGAVFIWSLPSGQTWSEQQTIHASDGATWDYFGRSVSMCAPALDGDGQLELNDPQVLVGAFRAETVNVGDVGTSYLYRGSN